MEMVVKWALLSWKSFSDRLKASSAQECVHRSYRVMFLQFMYSVSCTRSMMFPSVCLRMYVHMYLCCTKVCVYAMNGMHVFSLQRFFIAWDQKYLKNTRPANSLHISHQVHVQYIYLTIEQSRCSHELTN